MISSPHWILSHAKKATIGVYSCFCIWIVCWAKKATIGCVWYCIVFIVYLAPWLVTFPSIILTICPWPLKRTKSIENVPGKCILRLTEKIPLFFCKISKSVKAFLSNLWTKSILDTRPTALNYWRGWFTAKTISYMPICYLTGVDIFV